MKATFVSNFLNHHQIPFCEEMRTLVDEFYFIATECGSNQGYQTSTSAEYLIDYTTDTEIAKNVIISADVVIFGACPDDLIAMRMEKNKLSFLYSERFFKKGTWHRFIPHTKKKVINRIVKYSDKNMYVLCASAYLPYDLNLLGFPVSKCYKWGYFPNVQTTKCSMEKNESTILWTGRMLKWKHPEIAIYIAERLKKNGYIFSLDMIGDGEEFDNIRQMVEQKNLADCVKMHGSMTHDQLMEKMSASAIFLGTSDFKEGWGAVLNEAMGNGCAVVVSHAAGSTPFLVNNGENGLIFKSKCIKQAYDAVKYLLDNSEERQKMGENALQTITQLWNYRTAAKRFVKFATELLEKGQCDPYEEGPLCVGQIMKENWLRGH